MRRVIVALLVAAIGGGSILVVARWVAGDARAVAREAAEEEADRRVEGIQATAAAIESGDPGEIASGFAAGFGVAAPGASAGGGDEVVRRVSVRMNGTVRPLVVRAALSLPPHEPTHRTIALATSVAVLLLLLTLATGAGAKRDRQLEAAAERIGRGDLDVTLDGHSATASAFNRMTRELRETQSRLARAERIAAWRDIARRIAHEIKNPLTPIKMAMETLRKTHARKHPDFDEIFDESTKTVLEETARLERIVTEFSRFARMPRPKAESLDVLDVVERVVSMHDLPAAAATLPEAAKGVRVELAPNDAPLPNVRADREQLTQVFVNLVQNACDAAREKQGETGGRVSVRVERIDNDGVRVVVADNGPGIPPDARVAVLEPYYTTKSHGTGLGLAIVDRIVSDHGGTVALGDSAELGGAEVTITLRRAGPADESDASNVGV